jgi:hypothetical protein
MKEESGGVGLRLCRKTTGAIMDAMKGEVEGWGKGSSLW